MNRSNQMRILRSHSLLLGAAPSPIFLRSRPILPCLQYPGPRPRHATTVAPGPAVKTSSLLNPPASTRPASLDVPTRGPLDSTIGYYFQIGKAYLTFYKTGLKNVFVNRKILRSTLSRLPSNDRPSLLRLSYVPGRFTRADWVLLWRVRHDLLRIPVFGIVLMICGEFTPLLAIYLQGVMPYTCRLPKQLAQSMAKAEERRQHAFYEFSLKYPDGIIGPNASVPAARSHVLRSLHLISTFWDRMGLVPPGLWLLKGKSRMAFLDGDDRLLRQAGSRLAELEQDELQIACVERGFDLSGRERRDLLKLLHEWLRLTDAAEEPERRKRMALLFTTRPDKWPKSRDFTLPDWVL